MKRRRDWIDRLTMELDMPSEPMPGLPLVEISGDRRVLIENHRGVTQYGREKICVKVRYGQVAVLGHGLELVRMTKEDLIICGRIDGITLLRRNQDGCL